MTAPPLDYGLLNREDAEEMAMLSDLWGGRGGWRVLTDSVLHFKGMVNLWTGHPAIQAPRLFVPDPSFPRRLANGSWLCTGGEQAFGSAADALKHSLRCHP